MKRILSLLLALAFVMMLTACGDDQGSQDDTSSFAIEDYFDYTDDDTTDTDSTEDSTDETVSEEVSSKESASNDAWRDFLKEYEEWVDQYIKVVKKYKSNPADLSILTEYTKLMTELSDWSSRADDVGDSIVDASDAAEYSAEIMRIAAKLAKAAEEL